MAPQPKNRPLSSPVFAPFGIEGCGVSVPKPGQVLGRFHFGNPDAHAPCGLATDLRWLGGDQDVEVWETQAEVQRAGQDALAVSFTEDVLLTSLQIPIGLAEDPADKARIAYQRLVAEVQAWGYPWLLRAWNFIPGINRGEGDGERYRRFCLGRSLGLEDQGIQPSELCAATAVGTHGDRLIVHLLAGAKPGTPLENPRQMAAYRYPRIYGVRSPSFARALGTPFAGGRVGLLISGTASIVGHRTVHPYQTLPQLKETIQNLQAVLLSAKEYWGQTGSREFDNASLLRVYVRYPEQWPEIAGHLREVWPDVPLIGLEADICRRDLMLEIEAFHPL